MKNDNKKRIDKSIKKIVRFEQERKQYFDKQIARIISN